MSTLINTNMPDKEQNRERLHSLDTQIGHAVDAEVENTLRQEKIDILETMIEWQ